MAVANESWRQRGWLHRVIADHPSPVARCQLLVPDGGRRGRRLPASQGVTTTTGWNKL
jgi:hypothetical protein